MLLVFRQGMRFMTSHVVPAVRRRISANENTTRKAEGPAFVIAHNATTTSCLFVSMNSFAECLFSYLLLLFFDHTLCCSFWEVIHS